MPWELPKQLKDYNSSYKALHNQLRKHSTSLTKSIQPQALSKQGIEGHQVIRLPQGLKCSTKCEEKSPTKPKEYAHG